MKKRAAFIDHSFHKFTQCSVFLKRWFSEDYVLDEYYDDSWRGGSEPSMEKIVSDNYEAVFYFQFLHSFRKLSRISNKKIIWFPMEGIFAGRRNLLFLMQLTIIPLKVICFSKITYDKLRSYGFDCFYLQFFFNPDLLPEKKMYNTPPQIMFWQRNNRIIWDKVKRIIGQNRIDGVRFLLAPDPGQEVCEPSQDDVSSYHIHLERNLSGIDEYRQKLVVSDIFFTPRILEGIGMSFLEAMAMGLCVVAPNYSTMNEYIRSGENGLLYDPDNLHEISLADYEKMGREAKKNSAAGYLVMKERRTKLMNFVNSDYCEPGFSAKLKGVFRLLRAIF